MHVLMVSAYAPPLEGGSERYCFNLSKSLIKKGHDAEIYTSMLPPNLPWYEVREGVPIYRFRCYKYMLQINPLAFFMRAVKRNLENIDLIHVHSYIYFLANQIAFLRSRNKFPFILHLHGGLDYLYSSLRSYQATAMKVFYDRTIGKFTLKAADRLIACCENDKNNAVKLFGVDESKITVIHNSIEVERFTPSPLHNPINITFIGRISELKGSHQLPQIIEKVWRKYGDKVKFTVIGEGPKRQQLQQYCISHSYPTSFLGRVPNSEIPRLLNESSILILPSFAEGFPIVCIESLASAVPAIVYDVGGTKEIVKDGKTGLLIPVGNHRQFIDSLCWLIENEDVRLRMGLNGRQLVASKFNWKIMVQKIEETYRNVLRDF